MAANLVKRCPTCEAENPPSAARCGCGAFLIGIDLTERAVVGNAAQQREVATAVESHGSAARADPQPHAAPGDREAPNASEALPAPVCAFADCGQVNPRGSTICVYCNRSIAAVAAPGVGAYAGGSAHIAASDPARAGFAHDSSVREEAARPPGAERESRATLIRLPSKLATRFEIEAPLKAAGGEADLLVVRENGSGERMALKLYRPGIEPDTEVLDRVSRAAPDQLVRLIEHGRDEGVPYELLEYCEHGSLRTQLKGRPMPPAAARTLLVELADAIAHLHDCGIVHRDLKPENVLLRGLLPLDLVLTDFGIASVTQATMHHTSAARTLRYSAPEAGSNWVGKPTDYWALGMMLVEALTGRHPFDGLSDAVVAHWLVTRPIDVSGIEDRRWQTLCRGLLTRDPKTRWGADEIRRWLEGDDSLTVADDRPAPAAGAASPYRVRDAQCRTPRELAVALATHWSAGVKDLKRGMLRAWLANDLRDQNLARAAADAEEALEISDDERLLRLLLALDPALPPVFKGYDISIAGLAALARKALEDHNEERQTLLEILDRGILERFPGSPLQDVRVRFEEAKGEFEAALAAAFAAGAPRGLAPQGREWQLRMLLFVLEPPKGLIESLRASAARVGARAAQRCDWYRALGDPTHASPATLAAMVLLGPPAAQQGMVLVREAVANELDTLSITVDSNAVLRAAHGEARDGLLECVAAALDEDEVLALPQRAQELSQRLDDSVAAILRDTVFDGRTITEPAQLAELRRRIGDWARWRAGEAFAGFGEQITFVAAVERRSYRLRLTTQIETRRVPYKYGAADAARMPAGAKATLAEPGSCAMPALPQFAADLKLTRPQEVRCPRCAASGRVELQESWGTAAYPFSTTFACHDKVGVQCQTRLAWAKAQVAPGGVPAFVSDFVEAHAGGMDAGERSLALMAPRIPTRWIEALAVTAVRGELAAGLERVAQELAPHERVSAQRLRVDWNAFTEVRYRYRDKDYVVWIPEHAAVQPIALEHPLPSAAAASPPVAGTEGSSGGASTARTTGTLGDETMPSSQAPKRNLPRWLRQLLWCGGSLILAVLVINWIVSWKP